MSITQPKETWQEKLARLDQNLSQTTKRKKALELQLQDAKKSKKEAKDELAQFRVQVEHPIFRNLHAIFPSALIDLCKDYYYCASCLNCDSIYSCFTHCIFENCFQANVQLCDEDTKRLTTSPYLDTLVEILQTHEEHFTLKEQITSIMDQITSRGWIFSSQHNEYPAMPQFTGQFTIDGYKEEITVRAYSMGGWKHILFVCTVFMDTQFTGRVRAR